MIKLVNDTEPIKTLKKHIALNPEIAVCISVKKGETLIDISTPVTVGDLLVMSKVLEKQIDHLLFGDKK